MPKRTRLTEAFGVRHPIATGGMNRAGRAELVAIPLATAAGLIIKPLPP